MEAVLNLVWIALALGAFWAFVRCWPQSGVHSGGYHQALFALACALLLLFPIISASDDLHSTQAVLEEATKRVQPLASPLQLSPGSSTSLMLPILLALSMFFAVVSRRRRSPVVSRARALDGYHLVLRGRAPPFFGN